MSPLDALGWVAVFLLGLVGVVILGLVWVFLYGAVKAGLRQGEESLFSGERES